jgi:hypothetical protein
VKAAGKTVKAAGSWDLIEFARATAADFRGFPSSAAASRDVQNGQEDLLITAIDFTLIANMRFWLSSQAGVASSASRAKMASPNAST